MVDSNVTSCVRDFGLEPGSVATSFRSVFLLPHNEFYNNAVKQSAAAAIFFSMHRLQILLLFDAIWLANINVWN